jgi:hypothetical protein
VPIGYDICIVERFWYSFHCIYSVRFCFIHFPGAEFASYIDQSNFMHLFEQVLKDEDPDIAQSKYALIGISIHIDAKNFFSLV